MNIGRLISYTKAALGIFHGSRAFSGPVQANIDLTNRCNICCNHCYFFSPLLQNPNFESVRLARQSGRTLPDDKTINRMRQSQLHPEKLSSFINECLAMGTRRFQLSGGEPFLHNHLLESISKIKQAGSFCFLNTNGTLINHDIADELIRLKTDELRITLMAGSSDVYRLTHPGVSETMFESIRSNLQYLSEKKKEFGLQTPKIVLVSIVTNQNGDDLFNIAEFAKSVDAHGILYRPIDDIEDKGLTQIVPSPEQAENIRKQLGLLTRTLDSYDINHNISYFKNVFDTQLDTKQLYSIVPCYYGWLSVRINAEGDVYPCCRCYSPLGNIYKQNFSEIWHGEKYRMFRNNAKMLPRRSSSLEDCDCFSCVHHTANLRVFNILHPIKKHAVKKYLHKELLQESS